MPASPRRIKTVLTKLYTDPNQPSAFTSAQNLYEEARKLIPKLTLKQVNSFLETQDSYTLHKQLRYRFKRRQTIAPKINQQFQADLVDMQSLAPKNDKFRYILTCIDVLSRFAFAIPVKSKQGKDTVLGFKQIFRKRKPLKLQTDQGAEFLNKIAQDYFKQVKVIHFYSFSDAKCAIVERFNRTLQNRLYKYFTHNHSLRYIEALPKIVAGYNDTKHRMLGMKPSEVTPGKRELLAFKNLYGKQLKKRVHSAKYKVGDKVRIAKLRGAFQRGYLARFTTEIFTIASVNKIPPPTTYLLIDTEGEILRGIFYAAELSRVQS